MPESEFQSEEDKKKNLLSTGNMEMDKKLSDGLPLKSLNLIEGANGTGKSVIAQQMMWGGLTNGHTFALYTTEFNESTLLSQMSSLNLDVSDQYAWGYLRVFPIQVDGVKWNQELTKRFLDNLLVHMRATKEEVILFDSLTVFTISASQEDLFNFFADCKSMCAEGKTIIITFHTYAFNEDTLVRIRSMADGDIKLKLEEVGEKSVNMLEVAKVRGAKKINNNMVSFEVRPGYGIKVIPYASAQV
jgi:flagellar protein FlaH